MCNLYSMTRSREAMLRLFRVGDNRAAPSNPKPAIFPGYDAPIVRKAADGERELVNLNWGFVLLQKGRAPRRVTNVRDDKILDQQVLDAVFRAAPLSRAGVVVLRAEGREAGDVALVRGQRRRRATLFAFPGVWTRYRGPMKKNGDNVEQEVFAFMTTEPNELTASINHERMPVLISDPGRLRDVAVGLD